MIMPMPGAEAADREARPTTAAQPPRPQRPDCHQAQHRRTETPVRSRQPGKQSPCPRLPELVRAEVVARSHARQQEQRLGVRRAEEQRKRIRAQTSTAAAAAIADRRAREAIQYMSAKRNATNETTMPVQSACRATSSDP